MGKAYSEESRDQVKLLLQQDVAEDEIEKQTGVSDRTIRRWKLELERYGRIGKPPESRTGRHRVMNKDVEQALFDHVAQKPDLSVDDMLWWLYDNYKLVVGTRTIRRAFERRNTSHKKFRNDARKDMCASRESATLGPDEDSPAAPLQMPLQSQPQPHLHDDPGHTQGQTGAQANAHGHVPDQGHGQGHGQSNTQAPAASTQPMVPSLQQTGPAYQSPYAPMVPMLNNNNNNNNNNAAASDISPELARALGGLAQTDNSNIHPDLMDDGVELSEDEETLQLQLRQIALQKREVELKLKMRRIQRARRSSHTPRLSTDATDQSSFLPDMADMAAAAGVSNANATANSTAPSQPSPSGSPALKHRDSRSKSKVEEAKRRTEERQERMLKDLERRSRRRENLTAEWVQSRDVWAKGPEKLLVSLMHQHSTYAYNQNSLDTFEAIFHALYQLVDHTDWYPPVHDDLLRERTRRKMSQLRSKMVKSGEIISRGEGYGGWAKADDHLDDTNMSLDQQELHHQDMHHQDMHQQDMHRQEMHQHDMHPQDMHQHDMHPQDMHHQEMHPQDLHRSDMHQSDLHQQDLQHDLQTMSALPLDMTLGDTGEQPSEEAMIARNAMMHAPHDQNMLQHQPFQQHTHHQNAQPFVHDMHNTDFGHHPDHMPPQRVLQDSDLERQDSMGM